MKQQADFKPGLENKLVSEKTNFPQTCTPIFTPKLVSDIVNYDSGVGELNRLFQMNLPTRAQIISELSKLDENGKRNYLSSLVRDILFIVKKINQLRLIVGSSEEISIGKTKLQQDVEISLGLFPKIVNSYGKLPSKLSTYKSYQICFGEDMWNIKGKKSPKFDFSGFCDDNYILGVRLPYKTKFFILKKDFEFDNESDENKVIKYLLEHLISYLNTIGNFGELVNISKSYTCNSIPTFFP